MSKGDRTQHIKTLFHRINDAFTKRDNNGLNFAAGYYAALYNEGYINDEEHKYMLTIIETIGKIIELGFDEKSLFKMTAYTIKQCEKFLLRGETK